MSMRQYGLNGWPNTISFQLTCGQLAQDVPPFIFRQPRHRHQVKAAREHSADAEIYNSGLPRFPRRVSDTLLVLLTWQTQTCGSQSSVTMHADSWPATVQCAPDKLGRDSYTLLSPGRGSREAVRLNKFQRNHSVAVGVPGSVELSWHNLHNILILAGRATPPSEPLQCSPSALLSCA